MAIFFQLSQNLWSYSVHRAQPRKLFFLITHICRETVCQKVSLILWHGLYKWTTRNNTCKRVCWPVDVITRWLNSWFCDSSINTPFCLIDTHNHTHAHTCTRTHAHTHGLLYFRFLYPWGIPKVDFYVAGNSCGVNKCVLEKILMNHSWICYLGLEQESGHCGGMGEGRREHLPMSLPSPECSTAARLVWADICAGGGRASSPCELLLSGSQAGVMPQSWSLLKKWSLWNDRSALHLSQRVNQSEGLKEVGGWDCVSVAWGFPVIVGRETFEGSRSWCKHAVSLAVAAVKAEDDGVYGKCLLTLPSILFLTLLLFLRLSSWTFISVSAVFMAAWALHKCPNKDRSTMITSCMCVQTFIYVFFWATLGIKKQALVFLLLLLLLFLDLPVACMMVYQTFLKF